MEGHWSSVEVHYVSQWKSPEIGDHEIQDKIRVRIEEFVREAEANQKFQGADLRSESTNNRKELFTWRDGKQE